MKSVTLWTSVVVILIVSGTNANALKPAPTACQATKAGAAAITKGMEYSAIVVLIGCDGTVAGENKLGANGPVITMRWWSGNGGDNSNLRVQLRDGKMIAKGAQNLR